MKPQLFDIAEWAHDVVVFAGEIREIMDILDEAIEHGRAIERDAAIVKCIDLCHIASRHLNYCLEELERARSHYTGKPAA